MGEKEIWKFSEKNVVSKLEKKIRKYYIRGIWFLEENDI